ncbi:hypothetical protein [Pseudomonas typographi]|uniref:Uncharacterized protein n=1 Tax=Pseudomonas typographi TaxID=2715964 RepID=A0ABR7Z081_9PSED|nr:hypothetical protein [Pseudomonas typographi]MBD1598875.1 hypothetical protein [Pseudomonas typographi]
MTKYVIHYTLNGQRRWDYAQLQNGTPAEALAALLALHGESEADAIEHIRVSRAL